PSPPTSTLFPYTTLFRSGEDARAVRQRLHCREPQPRDGVRIHDGAVRGQRSHHLAAAVAHPLRAIGGPEMIRDDVAVVVVERSRDRKSTRLNSSHDQISY